MILIRWLFDSIFASLARMFYNSTFSVRLFCRIPMVVIRLARGGAKQRPFYNIVVADSRNRRDGRFIERVGYYNPVASGGEQLLSINTERLGYWKQNGAQLSPTVARLVKQNTRSAQQDTSQQTA
jgi:small subunit ribosomal protein S16